MIMTSLFEKGESPLLGRRCSYINLTVSLCFSLAAAAFYLFKLKSRNEMLVVRPYLAFWASCVI